VNIRNSKYASDMQPLEDDCPCPACTSYSRAYLHHTVKVGEMIGAMLLTWHNIQYFQDLMQRVRNAIINKQDLDFTC
jgi:queuine tRNA-ribosyltransferase